MPFAVTSASVVGLLVQVALGGAGITFSDATPVTLQTCKIFTAKQKNTIQLSCFLKAS